MKCSSFHNWRTCAAQEVLTKTDTFFLNRAPFPFQEGEGPEVSLQISSTNPGERERAAPNKGSSACLKGLKHRTAENHAPRSFRTWTAPNLGLAVFVFFFSLVIVFMRRLNFFFPYLAISERVHAWNAAPNQRDKFLNKEKGSTEITRDVEAQGDKLV
jgi:hypothetical protein